jgi:hypothetical protein
VNDRLTISASVRVKGDRFFSTGQSPFLADVFASNDSARIFDRAFWAQPQYWIFSIVEKVDHTACTSRLEKEISTNIRQTFIFPFLVCSAEALNFRFPQCGMSKSSIKPD